MTVTLFTAVTEREALAVHEAGHAVVMQAAGVGIRYATLSARHGGGQIMPTSGYIPRSSRWRNVLAVVAAGAIAEAVVIDDRELIVDASRDDLENLRTEARYVWTCKQAKPDHPALADVPADATVLDIAKAGWAHAHAILADRLGQLDHISTAMLRSPRALTGQQLAAAAAAAPRSTATLPFPADEFWPADHLRWKWAPTPARKPPRAARNDQRSVTR